MTDKSPAEMVNQIKAQMQEVETKNNEVIASLNETVKASSSEIAALKANAEKSATELANASASIVEMEQKMLEDVVKGKVAPETLGSMVVKSDAFKQFCGGQTNKMRVQANTITGQEGSPAENSDTLVTPDYLNGIVAGAFRGLRARDVIAQGRTTSNAIKYTKETLFTNAAAETAEGANKPESTLTFELVTANVATIAHFIKASKQVLDDSDVLESYIDNRLRYGVNLRYDSQIIAGDGAGENISGILNAGNHTAFTPVAGDNRLDSLNRMLEEVRLADYEANGIMLNPADWHLIEREKVGAGDSRYIVGNPNQGMMPMLWGKPVVVSNNVTAGTAIVGAFDLAYQIFDRDDTVVEMFEQDDTNVQQNLLTIRAERRGTLATYVPAAVQAGTLVV